MPHTRRHLLAGALGLTLAGTARPSFAAGPRRLPMIGAEEDLGTPITNVSLNDSAISEWDGRSVAYTTASGSTAMFNVIDVTAGALVASHPLAGVTQVWRHIVDAAGTVWIAATTTDGRGELWSYDPAADAVVRCAEIPGASSLWALTLDDAGRVYVGTYPAGSVVRFDPTTSQVHDYGRIVDGQDYVRSLAHADGTVFAGIGSVGAVVAIDVETGERHSISDELPALVGVEPADLPFAYSMAVAADTLVVQVHSPVMCLAFHDLSTGVWRQTVIGKDEPADAGAFNFTQLPVRDGKIWTTVNRRLVEITLADLSVRDVVGFGTSLRGAGWVQLDDPDRPGTQLATLQSGGEVTVFDVDAGTVKAYPSLVQGGTVPLHTIETIADGSLVMSGYPGGTGARHVPDTGQQTMFPLAQLESITTTDDGVSYGGVYPGGGIVRLELTESGGITSTPYVTLGHEQDRPYHMREHEGRLYVGSIPDYGRLGGALSVIDLADGETTVLRNVVQDQSVVGIAVRDGVIYGSTTTRGGLGIDPSQSEAKLFTVDARTLVKTGEYSLDLPSGQVPMLIGGLDFGPGRLLWGSADGYVFALDPVRMRIRRSVNIFPEVTRFGMWRPVLTRWGRDGTLYMNVAGRAVQIDPKSLAHRVLSDPAEEISFMTITSAPGGDGEALYLAGTTDSARLRSRRITPRR